MKKTFEINLSASNINYGSDKVTVNCSFSITDPKEVKPAGALTGHSFNQIGTYNQTIDFPIGAEPTKSDILAKVLAIDGITA
jgi:hypothetical protein